jgi:hypothetical protein
MLVKRTTYNAMKRRLEQDIVGLQEEIRSLRSELELAISSVDDNNETLARKLAAARDALTDILANQTKRPNATVQRIMSRAERGLNETK